MEWFVGIDVSKATLDAAVLGPKGFTRSEKFANDPKGHGRLLSLVRRLAGPGEAHWCMEPTGAYHWRLALFLRESGELVSVENPRRIKHFGVAIGSIQKTDKADAKCIARFAQTLSPRPWEPGSPDALELVFLDRRVTDLERLKVQESNRLEHPCLPELVVDGIHASLEEFLRQIALAKKRIDEIVASNAELSESVRLLTTIPGIAERAAIGLLVEAGDLSRYETAEDLAAGFGLHPRLRRSGTSLNGRTRISKAGNAHARCRLYMPAVVAIRLNPPVKEFYERLCKANKSKKEALVASERKLVMIAYGVLKSRKPFDPKHGRLQN